MGVPITKVTKLDGNTGVVKPSSKGIVAIIAASSSGVANQPTMETKANLAVNDFGYGVLPDFAAHIMSVSGNPVLCVKSTASTAGTNGMVTNTGAGTSVLTATGTPNDDYSVLVTFIAGGTQGVTGITYTYSLDGGLTTSAVQALGVATSITIPNSGVVVSLGVGTVLAGQTCSFSTTGPRLTTGDITTALDALRTSSQPWEMVLIASHDATSATITLVDTWLAAREAEGRYRTAILNAVPRTQGSQTEAAYLTAQTTAWQGVASIRCCVGADVGDLVSVLPGRGITQQRPVSLALAARAAKINYGVDPAYVQDGPVTGFGLSDTRGNPKNHDENLYPGLDALRLVSLRSFDRKAGTFITNANVLSTQGSDYVWLQHVRTMNRACELAFDILTNQLSRGVRKNPKAGPNGEIFIAEEEAQRIDALVNQSLTELKSQVSDLRFTLSRTDNIGASGPVTVNGDLKIAPLAYVKEYDVNAAFVRTVTVQQ
jgi:hypothetical protein